jgi:hypothetical protein
MEDRIMRRRRVFRAESLAELEGRVVLSHAGIAGASAHVAAFVPGARIPGRPVAPVPAGINAAFDSFVQDYTQARGVYLSVLTSSTTGSADASSAVNTSLVGAFTNYTRNRVDLLAQQLTGLFVHASASGGQGHQQQLAQGPGTNFYRVVQTRVNGLTTTSGDTGIFRVGSLGRALLESTPRFDQSNGIVALDTLAQDQAIETSRLAVTNGYSFYKTMNSGHNSKK